MPATVKSNVLVYRGSNFLRQRLLLSTLSGKPIRIIDIRNHDNEPGIKEFEVNLIRLLDKITNGSTVELNETGTSIFFQPGILVGGQLSHECCLQRGVGYYLEVLLALGPFCKEPLNITLYGATYTPIDVSPEKIKASALPILMKFILVDDGLSLKIKRRAAQPLGGGEVIFQCPVRRLLRPLQWESWGLVKRIRGLSYALRVSPAIANRIVESAKGIMLNFLPDVYINTDQCKGAMAGKSPGFGVTLVAETNEGSFYCSEQISETPSGGVGSSTPEDIGTKCANNLLDEIFRCGCVDSGFQWLLILWMALGQKDVSRCVVGPLSDYTIAFLQHLKEFFGIMFKIEVIEPKTLEDEDDDNEGKPTGSHKVSLTCIGIGYANISKRSL